MRPGKNQFRRMRSVLGTRDRRTFILRDPPSGSARAIRWQVYREDALCSVEPLRHLDRSCFETVMFFRFEKRVSMPPAAPREGMRCCTFRLLFDLGRDRFRQRPEEERGDFEAVVEIQSSGEGVSAAGVQRRRLKGRRGLPRHAKRMRVVRASGLSRATYRREGSEPTSLPNGGAFTSARFRTSLCSKQGGKSK